MSLDKFGRFSDNQSVQGIVGPKGDGFLLTPEGDFDIANKRLKQVQSPSDELDGVNFETLKKYSLDFDSEKVNINGRRIINLHEPNTSTDAINLEYFDKHCLRKSTSVNGESDFDANLTPISNLPFPRNPRDAINHEFFTSNTMNYHPSKGFDAKNNVISNLAAPKQKDDAVTLGYLNKVLRELL